MFTWEIYWDLWLWERGAVKFKLRVQELWKSEVENI